MWVITMDKNTNIFQSRLLSMRNYIEEISEQEIDKTRRAVKKMCNFLTEKGIVISASEVKKLSRIEIKGFASNGLERLLRNDVIEKYGFDTVEESEGYNTIYPLFDNGVILSRTEKDGSYYTHFFVMNESDEYFDLEIHEYRFHNQVFYLNYVVYIENLPKKMPMSETSTRYASIKNLFFDQYSRDELKDFSDDELESLMVAMPSEEFTSSQIDAITSTTISTIRIVNFLKEKFSTDIKSLYDNEFFVIKNWNGESDDKEIISTSELQKELYYEKILHIKSGFQIVDINMIGNLIPEIVKRANIDTFFTAVGFAFRSGLSVLESSLKQISERSGIAQMVIGALQNYDNENANNKIDRNTVCYLNELMDKNYMQLYTYKPSFYHGKFYYMSNDKKAYIFIGSSNISRTAFNNNVEMDIIHVYDKGSAEEQLFLEWFHTFQKKCERIEKLDEALFGEYNWTSELDAFQSLKNQKVSKDYVQAKIENLTDEELKFRLTLWLDKNPTDIYEDIDIEALEDYTMFVYAENRLVVFESYVPGNAYYVFRYKKSLVDLFSEISVMSKRQMALSSHYISRGYHVQAKEKIKQRIEKYFM